MSTTLSLSNYLREGTHDLHDVLDKRVMQINPFSDIEHYRDFLRMQLRLHAAAESLYHNDQLLTLLPELTERSRLNDVIQDCLDVGLDKHLQIDDQRLASDVDIADHFAGIGWLYTLEGSTLGAAMLLKHAKSKLELSETYGAHHMAAHSDGRAIHWKQFKSMLDNLDLDEIQRKQALAGATQAFLFVTQAVDEIMIPNVVA